MAILRYKENQSDDCWTALYKEMMEMKKGMGDLSTKWDRIEAVRNAAVHKTD